MAARQAVKGGLSEAKAQGMHRQWGAFWGCLYLVLVSAAAPVQSAGLKARVQQETEAERQALLSIKAALQPGVGDPNFWIRARWLAAGPPPCGTPTNLQSQAWKYISCSPAGRVTQINLDASKTGAVELTGVVPWANLTALTALQIFSANNHNISGDAFPQNMPILLSLLNLDLSDNQLTSLTSQVSQLPSLRELNLMGNKLTGSLPGSLSSLSRLSRLDLSYNIISGSIPSAAFGASPTSAAAGGTAAAKSAGALPLLVHLNLMTNQLTGPLPQALSSSVRLTFLHLEANKLTGGVPPSWYTLNQSLADMSLANNQLTGLFPTVLNNFSSLTRLDLSFNQFWGPVPTSLWTSGMQHLDISSNYLNGTVPANRSPNIGFAENCFSFMEPAGVAPASTEQRGVGGIGGSGYGRAVALAAESAAGTPSANISQRSPGTCTAFYATVYPAPPPSVSVANVGLIVGLSAGLTAFILALGLFVLWRLRQSQRLARRLRKGTTQSTREFRIWELKVATKNWSLVLGQGGYGTVYKAVLRDGSTVAVKRLDQVSDQGDQEFIREVELLSRVHHRHLVNLVGFCGEKGERSLVYEYMGLGSLHEHLHGECAAEQPLSWDSRIKIAIHVAFGIDYLHYGADPPLIHRDIKSANILLSEDGYAKVADFGLCKEAPVGTAMDGTAQLVPPQTEVRGSFGYLDPEYVNTSVLSEKSDVYSYGVVLLELISGKRPIHDFQPLAYWAESYLVDSNKMEDLVDPALGDAYDPQELQILCEIARSCTLDHAAMRPAIRDVAQALVENLGRVVAMGVADSSAVSSEVASVSDPAVAAPTADSCSTFLSEYSWRHAASEALILGFKKFDGDDETNGEYHVSKGPSGNKPPVPISKFFQDSV